MATGRVVGEGRGGRRGSILAQVVYLLDGYPVHYIGDGLGGGRDGEDDGEVVLRQLRDSDNGQLPTW